MPSNIVHKIFISSTYTDLKDERAEVQMAILRIGCLPIGMELFESTSEDTWDFIKGQIDDADYYVLMVAGRYGSIADDGISFTEKEYLYAMEIGKPIIAFIRKDIQDLPGTKLESDSENRIKLERFITDIQKTRHVNFFTSPQDLSSKFLSSFFRLREKNPAEGYVRAGEVVSAGRYLALLDENRKLKDEILRTSAPSLDAIQEFSEIISLDITHKAQPITKSLSFGQIFIRVSEIIIINSNSESAINWELISTIISPELLDAGTRFANQSQFNDIKIKLYRLGLIDVTETRTARTLGGYTMHNKEFHWSLTEMGRKHYQALIRTPASPW
ncbi:DUF4062 domain-containing protein [Nitrospirillum sp. BR 11163]|uniref:DUF4062 domain-containing protein n=1 Tax=Nitrospirillum sp. BR 11163 TaxID=3104323 RepID=UPI002AFE9B53|nr:DUF4062 domain-containing protein [Nitrospirillum sp. BR 11163]MEA1674964.1 DUF4062 domain-containing protein [Nitrospirillum sp. BR 11163]